MLDFTTPPVELFNVLGVTGVDELCEMLLPGGEELHTMADPSEEVGEDVALAEGSAVVDGPAAHIDRLRRRCTLIIDEIEAVLESLGQGLMSRLVSADPMETPTIEKFFMRLLDAIQMCNDERVQACTVPRAPTPYHAAHVHVTPVRSASHDRHLCMCMCMCDQPAMIGIFNERGRSPPAARASPRLASPPFSPPHARQRRTTHVHAFSTPSTSE